MSRFHRTRTLLICLALTANAAWAEEMDPKALAALDQMGAYLRSLQQFRIEADSRTDQVLENGQVVEFSHRAHLVARQPDKLQVSLESDGKRRSLFYNGKSFTLYDSRSGYFANQAAPADIGSLLDQLSERYGIELPLADLFRWHPGTAKDVGISSALLIGDETINATACTHYAFRQPDIDWQLWVRQGPRPLPCRVVISRRDTPELPRHSVNYHWQFNGTINPKDFEFVPPAGARSVPLQQLEPQGEQP
ncbi:hypothetical protein BFW87_25900 [Pseudomonas fluorescens]|uniref:DUF2092 domain-containing protein n=1 Tax=Pseudomonas fluorescens TaxID=294 RepID=A0A1T2Y2C0_PSEFL|nr:DUF2092 domain-containing protein [Pseudomonas fluorescens]OPA86183.1 hypothetical protein BFW87_25900 [Pseudomonas fluorescens]